VDIIFKTEKFRPSYMLVAAGIGTMIASDIITVRPVQDVLRNTGAAIALTGVMAGMIEQTLEQTLRR
jgi:hypothetical protein